MPITMKWWLDSRLLSCLYILKICFFSNPSRDVIMTYLCCYFNDVGAWWTWKFWGFFFVLATLSGAQCNWACLSFTGCTTEIHSKSERLEVGLGSCFIRLGLLRWGKLLPGPPHVYLPTVGQDPAKIALNRAVFLKMEVCKVAFGVSFQSIYFLLMCSKSLMLNSLSIVSGLRYYFLNV